MAKDFVSYEKLIDAALRSVVRRTLRHVAERGLSGPHHIHLSFQTGYPGVEMPEHLRTQYPDEMTIVLQHEFWGLEVEDSAFAVTLSFNNMQERLSIPFDAITRFADPGVRFGLQFQSGARPPAGAKTKRKHPAKTESKPEAGAQVITLDSFRKK